MSSWIKNTGEMPEFPEDAKIFVRFRMHIEDAKFSGQEPAELGPYGFDLVKAMYWDFKGMPGDVLEYRYACRQPAPVEVEVEADPSYKDTNPKDAIGIRKAPMSVLSMAVLAEVGVGVLEGASKYGRHNWRGAGIRESVYFDATMRHLMSYWEGEDVDPDSGLSHVTKAICSLMVWRDALIQGMATDDRPPRSAEFYPALNKLAGELVDKHADKKPHHWTVADFE